MRATVQLIQGHENTLFQRGTNDPSGDVVSWDRDESDDHASHDAPCPACAKCLTGTGDWKLVSLVDPDAPDAAPEPKSKSKPASPASEV